MGKEVGEGAVVGGEKGTVKAKELTKQGGGGLTILLGVRRFWKEPQARN